jgi:hypothetical protein
MTCRYKIMRRVSRAPLITVRMWMSQAGLDSATLSHRDKSHTGHFAYRRFLRCAPQFPWCLAYHCPSCTVVSATGLPCLSESRTRVGLVRVVAPHCTVGVVEFLAPRPMGSCLSSPSSIFFLLLRFIKSSAIPRKVSSFLNQLSLLPSHILHIIHTIHYQHDFSQHFRA